MGSGWENRLLYPSFCPRTPAGCWGAWRGEGRSFPARWGLAAPRSCPHLLQPLPKLASSTGNERACWTVSVELATKAQGSHLNLFMHFYLERGERKWPRLGLATPSSLSTAEVLGLAAHPLPRTPLQGAGRARGREMGCHSLLGNEMVAGKRWPPELAQGPGLGGSRERWLPDGERGPPPAREEEEGEEGEKRRHLQGHPETEGCRLPCRKEGREEKAEGLPASEQSGDPCPSAGVWGPVGWPCLSQSPSPQHGLFLCPAQFSQCLCVCQCLQASPYPVGHQLS